jgi:two-component system chemotaxis response regulator CheY
MTAESKDEHKKFKIIIVDDNPLARKTISSILDKAGYSVIGEVESPDKALYMAKVNPAHLYIVDIVMPEKSGIEFTKEVNELSGQKWTILISSLTSDHIMIESISCGASDFLKKPFNQEDLLRSVEKIYYLAKAEKVF